MKSQELERTAYTVECFLNALRLDDGPVRTAIEEWLVRWLAGDTRKKGDHAIYSQGNIFCHSNARVVKSFSLPEARQTRAVWCDAAKLSAIDANAYARNGQLVMLGTAGLVLALPGTAAGTPRPSQSEQRSSNNNNNNNNNNNG